MTTKRRNYSVNDLIIKNGNYDIYGKLYSPAKGDKHPAVILSHGFNGSNDNFVDECILYASNGYIAYAFDFCGSSHTSKSSLQSTDMTIFTEKSDLLSVFNYISALKNVDYNHIFLLGASQGGLVTSLVAEELNDKIKGMILYYPALCIPDDWRNEYPDFSLIPKTRDLWGLSLGHNFFVSIHDFEVFDHIGNFDKDIIILHGDNDSVVPIKYSKKAIEQYQNAKLITLHNEGHGFSPSCTTNVYKEVLTFLNLHTGVNKNENI